MRTGAKDRAAYYLTLCKHSLSIQCEILFVLQSGIKSSLDFRCHSRPFIIPGRPVRHIQLYHDNILSLYRRTRTLLVALSLACLEMSFNVKGPGAVILLFRLGYKTSVVCHNVYTQKVKIARRDRLHILASNRCETFENLLHIDIAPLRSTLSGILHSKN